jgi:site-specific recombinase XerD
MRPGQPWLFPGYRGQHMSPRQLHRLVCLAAARAGIAKRVGVHTLRHNSERRIIPSPPWDNFILVYNQ